MPLRKERPPITVDLHSGPNRSASPLWPVAFNPNYLIDGVPALFTCPAEVLLTVVRPVACTSTRSGVSARFSFLGANSCPPGPESVPRSQNSAQKAKRRGSGQTTVEWIPSERRSCGRRARSGTVDLVRSGRQMVGQGSGGRAADGPDRPLDVCLLCRSSRPGTPRPTCCLIGASARSRRRAGRRWRGGATWRWR